MAEPDEDSNNGVLCVQKTTDRKHAIVEPGIPSENMKDTQRLRQRTHGQSDTRCPHVCIPCTANTTAPNKGHTWYFASTSDLAEPRCVLKRTNASNKEVTSAVLEFKVRDPLTPRRHVRVASEFGGVESGNPLTAKAVRWVRHNVATRRQEEEQDG
ncbi:hypothetical protein QQS21_012592 [Conoideocrella luteorostrata]|uniref:Uncharacterized protein n=1 Tax=Conoideocrella luteorostrata TaxID=1105319 RepID=A0AAJ0CAW7_9HYPO|nr:hypothetical protein QQS21_012592 [Conoideocrella luteorostrata]